MKTFKAKLLKDLTYINGCKLRKGEIISVTRSAKKSNWVIDADSNHLIKIFCHDFEVIS